MRIIHDLFEHYQLVRRLAVLWCATITTIAVLWVLDFADAHPESGMTAGIIAAGVAPIAVLQGWVLQIYTSGRKEN